MKSGDRRELVLEAATSAFGDHGYVGTTTDQVARAAGVSQPYVVRMFGTKEKLFLAVLERAIERLLTAFRAVLAEPSAAEPDLHVRLGNAYVELLRDRGILLSLMHAFVLGSDPVVGAAARAGFLEVYRVLRDEAGFSPDEVREFLAHGMLINTMVGLRMGDDYESNPAARELLHATLPSKLDVLLKLGENHRPGER
jgi:AcrR family transcriptional regulator